LIKKKKQEESIAPTAARRQGELVPVLEEDAER